MRPIFIRSAKLFSQTFVLPNIAPLTATGKPDKQGPEILRQLALNRLEPHLIAANALHRAVMASGGVPTSLVRLIQNAATYANGDTISLQDMSSAILTEREFMTPLLTEADWRVLQQRRADHRLTSDDENQILLYKGALVEYRNHKDGQPWCDAHPILWDVLKKSGTGQASDRESHD